MIKKLGLSRSTLLLLLAGLLCDCSSGYLKYEKADQLNDIKEFDQQVKIVSPVLTPTPSAAASPGASVTPAPQVAAAVPSPTPEPTKKESKRKKHKGKEAAVVATPTPDPTHHEPDVEGQKGFTGRRPNKDPFRTGEKLNYEVSYFNIKAGDLQLSVQPFAQVNGRKSYHFQIDLNTSALFNNFYEVNDQVISMMDYETMKPVVFTLHVKETGQLREARFLHDWKKNQASYWEKKVTKKDGPEEKKQTWDVPEYSQDVFSSAFYLRVFPWDVGSEVAFQVADNEENLIFKGTAIRRETLTTRAGTFNAIVIKPEVQLRGQFKPVGDVFIWLSDDDRHYILRIESKIKIGTIIAQVNKIEPGHDESP